MWHAAGANRSGQDRLAINQQFTRSYVKQQVDYVRALGDSAVGAQKPRTQLLLGWYTRVVTSLDEYLPSRRPASVPQWPRLATTPYSVVVPVYRCDECLRALQARLVPALESITSDYEIIYVDDRSPDGAWATLKELAAASRHVHAIRLSRNFGQQAAITAGLAHSAGRFTVVMDCDLQDPPEVIPELYAKAVEGYDIVLARRTGRRHSLRRRLSARLYQRFLKISSASRSAVTTEPSASSRTGPGTPSSTFRTAIATTFRSCTGSVSSERTSSSSTPSATPERARTRPLSFCGSPPRASSSRRTTLLRWIVYARIHDRAHRCSRSRSTS